MDHFNSRMEKTDERVNEFDNGSIEIIQCELVLEN
jgi:hypothetical protein